MRASAAHTNTENTATMATSAAMGTAPWWVRVSRWAQTSPAEAAAAQNALLQATVKGAPLYTANVPCGPGQQDYLNTVSSMPLPDMGIPAGGLKRACNVLRGTGAAAAAAEAPSAGASPLASIAAAAGAGPGGPPVVMMPGYGAGTGFFWRNFAPLASFMRLYAVDWLGTGLSGRPRFTAKSREETEDFFINSLAAWRQQVGLDKEKMVLVGHSLGGYLSAAYALRHPEHVQHLVLVCPAGVPQAPEDWEKNFVGARSGRSSWLFRTAMWCWEAGVTPHSIIRTLGPWGPRVANNYVRSRFSSHGASITEQEAELFGPYLYSIIAQQGSGEYALRHLLAPGAWAHAPLVQRLKDLKVPVTFIYGESDWMRPQHAVDLCRQLKEERKPKLASDLHVEIIEDAGHFVFIDQPELFNAALLDACRTYLPKAPAGPTSRTDTSSSWSNNKAGEDVPVTPAPA